MQWHVKSDGVPLNKLTNYTVQARKAYTQYLLIFQDRFDDENRYKATQDEKYDTEAGVRVHYEPPLPLDTTTVPADTRVIFSSPRPPNYISHESVREFSRLLLMDFDNPDGTGQVVLE